MSIMKLKIPPTLRVGYNERGGTYTGKLGYVTYLDEKGKHRKKTSWDNWRDEKLGQDDYPNDPTSGFVINNNVGGGGGGWHWYGRMEKVRVLDPRGFEIEITTGNLLFILGECDSIKGKGLQGDFVYAMDGKDLVLLPTCSEDYKVSSDFTGLQTKKITKKDMVEGCWYKNKNDVKVMYLGRHEYYEEKSIWSYKTDKPSDPVVFTSHSKKKKHIFVEEARVGKKKGDSSYYTSYWPQAGFTALAEKITDETDPAFADEYDKFIHSNFGSMPVQVVEKKVTLNKERDPHYNDKYDYTLKKIKGRYDRHKLFCTEDGIIYECAINMKWDYGRQTNNSNDGQYTLSSIHVERKNRVDVITDEKTGHTSLKITPMKWHDGSRYGYSYHDGSRKHAEYKNQQVTDQELLNIQFYTLKLANQYGTGLLNY